MDQRLPLTVRKRLQARERIVRAADELFTEHGFANVSVADIADRAEVGRTTFFRQFGDKQEVVFAQEEELIATITAAHQQSSARVPSTPQEAIAQLRDIVLVLCAQATQDPTSYSRHYTFIEQSIELRARDALKMQQFAERFAELLTARGADTATALFASQIALACYQTAKGRKGNDPRSLVAEARVAFEQTLSLGCDPTG
ncbi:MAG: TetR/AcrR family transcriptional regulator [Actinomycetota bacterium]|nr:TetR/AcrR family transcriptional regulator [Actinomycetota bacterium]